MALMVKDDFCHSCHNPIYQMIEPANHNPGSKTVIHGTGNASTGSISYEIFLII